MQPTRDIRSQFLVVFHGHLDTALFPQARDICFRLSYVKGPDWTLVGGLPDIASAHCNPGTSNHYVINLPFDATFSSTNPFKWPRLVFSCYGSDFFGHEVVLGYGSVCLPTTPGTHKREVPIFVPESSTLFQRIVGFFWGKRPELLDPTIVARSQGRDVLRVSTKGLLRLTITVTIKDLKKFGFDATAGGLTLPFDMPPPDYGLKK